MFAPPDFPSPDRASFVEVNRTQLRVWEWGDPSDPPVICAHGAFDHGRMFDGLAPQVAAAGYHVMAVDTRGHGDSGRLTHGHTWRTSVVDFGELVARQGQPVGFIGHSMGGGLAAGVSGTWPENVAWLVLLDSLGPPQHEFEDFDPRTAVTQGFDYLLRQLGRGVRVFPDKEAMADQRGSLNTRLPKDWLAHLVDKGSVANGDGWSWKWDPLFNTGFWDGFDPEWVRQDFLCIEAPTLVLMGAEDDMWSNMPPAEVQDRLHCIANHQHHDIAGGGHYLHLEQPDVVLKHIESFLSELSS